MRESVYLQAIQTALHGAGLPYGYAITVWATGAALAAEHGVASPVELYLFAAGAVVLSAAESGHGGAGLDGHRGVGYERRSKPFRVSALRSRAARAARRWRSG